MIMRRTNDWLLLLLLALFAARCNARNLLFVQAIWRHGDRAPGAKPYPNDTYDESYWPRGWKEITNLGMRQMKELGQFYRQRYGDFVGHEYKPDEVFVQSSDETRALVSAQAFLNGFYPPYENNDKFESDLGWQPIAVHASSPYIPDPLLKPTNFNCPNYDELVGKILANVEMELRVKYAKLIEFLAPYINNGKIPTIKQVGRINDINREISHNYTQPDWVFKRWPQYDNQTTVELASDIWLRRRIAMFKGDQLARLRGGFLLGDWLKRARRILRAEFNSDKSRDSDSEKDSETNEDPIKMQLYSSHDGTILSLLSAMNLNPHGFGVPYAASLIMEIYKDNNKTLTAELYYRHNGVLERIKINNCAEPCELSNFIKTFKKMAIFREKNLYKKCGLSNYCSPYKRGQSET